jgi:hypothetical protein
LQLATVNSFLNSNDDEECESEELVDGDCLDFESSLDGDDSNNEGDDDDEGEGVSLSKLVSKQGTTTKEASDDNTAAKSKAAQKPAEKIQREKRKNEDAPQTPSRKSPRHAGKRKSYTNH